MDEIGQDTEDMAALLGYKLKNRQGFILPIMLYKLNVTAGRMQLTCQVHPVPNLNPNEHSYVEPS